MGRPRVLGTRLGAGMNVIGAPGRDFDGERDSRTVPTMNDPLLPLGGWHRTFFENLFVIFESSLRIIPGVPFFYRSRRGREKWKQKEKK